MKNFKEIIIQIRDLAAKESPELQDLLWEVLFYSANIPLKPHQQQVLDEAEKFSLKITDQYSNHRELSFNGFKWGNGRNKIFLTHGWASKAADFSDMITALRELDDITLISFDAPGNGSSEATQSNLLLYIEALKATIQTYGQPDILIGHSLGVMANVMTLQQLADHSCSLMISLSPLIRLKENFIALMDAVRAPLEAKNTFMDNFEAHFNVSITDLGLDRTYTMGSSLKHWLAYDVEDQVAPDIYLQEFLKTHPAVAAKSYQGLGHDRILKDPEVIADVLRQIRSLAINFPLY